MKKSLKNVYVHQTIQVAVLSQRGPCDAAVKFDICIKQNDSLFLSH